MIEPKLFGTHHCRVCDQSFDLIDMSPQDTGICLDCDSKIKLGLLDKSGKVIND